MRVKDVGFVESAAEAMPARNDLGPRARVVLCDLGRICGTREPKMARDTKVGDHRSVT